MDFYSPEPGCVHVRFEAGDTPERRVRVQHAVGRSCIDAVDMGDELVAIVDPEATDHTLQLAQRAADYMPSDPEADDPVVDIQRVDSPDELPFVMTRYSPFNRH